MIPAGNENGFQFITLRLALELTSGILGEDKIVFDNNLFLNGHQTLKLDTAKLGALPEISDDLILEGPGSQLLTIDNNANVNNKFDLFVFAVVGQRTGGGIAKVSGLELTNSWSSIDGGAIRNRFYALVLEDVWFNNCTSDGDGGGLWSDGHSLSITNCYFSACTALLGAGGQGGGACIKGSADPVDPNLVNITNTDFFACEASKGGGAIAFLGNNLYATIGNADFDSNMGNEGGAIYASAGGANAGLSFSGCTFDANQGGDGGAINLSTWAGTFSSCDFTNNYASNTAGAVFVKGKSLATFNTCSFSGNSSSITAPTIGYFNIADLVINNCTGLAPADVFLY